MVHQPHFIWPGVVQLLHYTVTELFWSVHHQVKSHTIINWLRVVLVMIMMEFWLTQPFRRDEEDSETPMAYVEIVL